VRGPGRRSSRRQAPPARELAHTLRVTTPRGAGWPRSAHEISQPLTAIVTNAEADASDREVTVSERRTRVTEALADIKADAVRALAGHPAAGARSAARSRGDSREIDLERRLIDETVSILRADLGRSSGSRS